MIVLDTTVLTYAVGAEHEYRDPCRDLIEAVGSGRLRATTTVEVIQEFAHVRARRRGRPDARRLASAYVDLLAPLLVSSEASLRAGLELWATSEALGAFDAVLAAVAKDTGAAALVSTDRGFVDVPGLRVLDPERAVAALLP